MIKLTIVFIFFYSELSPIYGIVSDFSDDARYQIDKEVTIILAERGGSFFKTNLSVFH